MHYVRKNDLFLARLPGISATSKDNSRRYNFQAFANISRNFQKLPKIFISGKFTTLGMITKSMIRYEIANFVGDKDKGKCLLATISGRSWNLAPNGCTG